MLTRIVHQIKVQWTSYIVVFRSFGSVVVCGREKGNCEHKKSAGVTHIVYITDMSHMRITALEDIHSYSCPQGCQPYLMHYECSLSRCLSTFFFGMTPKDTLISLASVGLHIQNMSFLHVHVHAPCIAVQNCTCELQSNSDASPTDKHLTMG